MATLTPNYNLIKPAVNDPTDQDLWGGYLNDDMDIIDTTMKSISDSVSAVLPAGSILPFAGSSTPSGFLLCYGQAISRSTYAVLFSAIGTTWGSGDGSTTFNLPDLRGRAFAGKDDMGGSSANRITTAGCGIDGDVLGATGGSETHTLVVGEMPSHSHDERYKPSGTGGNTPSVVANASGTATNMDVTTGSTGGDGAHNNVQPSAIVNFIIKT